jgi:hypothetical protein
VPGVSQDAHPGVSSRTHRAVRRRRSDRWTRHVICIMWIGLIKKMWGASCRCSHLAATAASCSVCRSGTLSPTARDQCRTSIVAFRRFGSERPARGIEQVSLLDRCDLVVWFNFWGSNRGQAAALYTLEMLQTPESGALVVELRGFEPLTPSMRTPCGAWRAVTARHRIPMKQGRSCHAVSSITGSCRSVRVTNE